MWFAESGGIQRTAQSSPDLKYGIALMPKGNNRGVTLRGSILQVLSGSKLKEAAARSATFVARDDNSLLYTKAVSYPPTKKANEDKEPYVSNPMWKIAVEQAKVKETIFQPSFPGYVEGSLRLAEEIVAVFQGKKSVKTPWRRESAPRRKCSEFRSSRLTSAQSALLRPVAGRGRAFRRTAGEGRHGPAFLRTKSSEREHRTAGGTPLVGGGDLVGRVYWARRSGIHRMLLADGIGQPYVLVVDDEPSVSSLVAAALREEGLAVREAAGGAEALALLERAPAPPALILLDLLMPGMDGAAFARAYQGRPGPHAPVVLFTASVPPDGLVAEIGATDTLHKPFEVAALLAVVIRHLAPQ